MIASPFKTPGVKSQSRGSRSLEMFRRQTLERLNELADQPGLGYVPVTFDGSD